jgi:ribosomal protein S18 acetylase RimI-like enzyme
MATTSPPQYIYKTLRIPPNSPHLATKYRATKLAALTTSPTSFAVTLADESLHPPSTWQARLTPPSIILVCVATTPTEDALSEEDLLLEREWIGFATIRGPLSWENLFFLPESGQPVPADVDAETMWHLCNVYTSPAHRRRGISTRLISAATEIARAHTKELQGAKQMRARIRLFCSPKNEVVVSLYAGLGFVEAGRITLEEAFVANGDEGVLPRDRESTEMLRERWKGRGGLAMERVVDV